MSLAPLEIEGQYYISEGMLEAIKRKLPFSHYLSSGPISCGERVPWKDTKCFYDGESRNRPISVYFDTEDHDIYRVANGEVCYRIRYGIDPYPAVVCAKHKDLYITHSDLLSNISIRREAEAPVANESFQFFKPNIYDFCASLPKEMGRRIKAAVGDKPLVTVFATAAERTICGYEIIPDNKREKKKVYLELALDNCSFYALNKNATLWVSEDVPLEDRSLAVLAKQKDIFSSEINGTLLATIPQLELEYKENLSDRGVELEDILAAEHILVGRYLQSFQSYIKPKPSKWKEGMGLVKAHEQKTLIMQYYLPYVLRSPSALG